MQKWNYEKREYEPYVVPEGWKVSCYEPDMDSVVNCANCGKKILFGDGYTSLRIHTEYGMGFTVCHECYLAERCEELEVRKHG